MTINEMRAKRANAWDEAKKFLDTHTNSDGTMSAEDAATYDRMENDITNLTNNIQRMERAEEAARSMNDAVNKVHTSKPGEGAQDETGRASKAYNASFWTYARNRAVSNDVLNALQVGTDSEGGYLVPDEFDRNLIEALEEENVMRRIAHVIRTNSGDRKIPVVASRGTASWVDEEAAIPESDNTFGQKTLSAYKLASMIKVSEELLQDSAFNLPAYIAREMARRFSAAEELAFLTGDGTGKPTGIFHETKGGEVGVTAASATAITGDEIIDLYHSLRTPYRRKAKWLMNDTTVKLIRKLKDASNGNYLWQPGLQAGQPDMLMGREIITCAGAPEAAADARAIAFGDFSYYWIADRKARTLRRLNELYAVNGQVAFIATQRVDGALMLPEAVKILQMKAGA